MSKKFEVLYDWSAENDDDLQLYAGEILDVMQQNDHGWWYGIANRGGTIHKGYFPKNYVREVVEVPDVPRPPPRPSLPKVPDPPVPSNSTAVGEATELAEPLQNLTLKRGPTFSLKTLPAFDELKEVGYTVEIGSSEQDRTSRVAPVVTFDDADGRASSKKLIQKLKLIEVGTHVEMMCTARTWDGASTEMKQYASGIVNFVAGEGKVPPGLDRAVQRLSLGQKATVTCAPLMAYGPAGNPPTVPPNSFVIFSIEIKSTGAKVEPMGKAGGDGSSVQLDSGVAAERVGTGVGADGGGNRSSWRSSRILLSPMHEQQSSQAPQQASQPASHEQHDKTTNRCSTSSSSTRNASQENETPRSISLNDVA
mmetsp:Transcript_5446/g.8908  ORF Transcript_5446/g.8908 Transcript_5446/m.8908 type:complete len:366 (-) Transcript_5446:10-1107(-)